jgi:hypothetical protein
MMMDFCGDRWICMEGNREEKLFVRGNGDKDEEKSK